MAGTFDRITERPEILAGRATVRGLRISVAHLVNLVANGMTPAQIIEERPDLQEEDVRQALGYAAAMAQDERRQLVVDDYNRRQWTSSFSGALQK